MQLKKCPAFGQSCNLYKKKNHFAKMCRSQVQRKQQGKRVHTVEQRESDNDMFLGAVNTEEKVISMMDSGDTNTEIWTENFKINKKQVSCKLDTVADCNVMSVKTLTALEAAGSLKASQTKLVPCFGHKVAAIGKKQLIFEYKGKKHQIEFEITQEDVSTIIEGTTCLKIGLVQRVYAVGKEQDILKDYNDLFDGLGCLPGQHHIQIDPSVSPVVHAPRRIPVALRDRVVKELQRMENMGVIIRQTEATEWVNSMVTVVTPKKIRICMDPKDLNRAIKREHYPLLTVEEVVSRMPNAKYFSVLDANQGFWQIKLDDESSRLRTFNTPIGRYRFLRLPFGISSAPEVFQRAVAQMIEDLDGVVNIIDDLLVWGDSKEEHDDRLRKLLDRARQYNLKLNRNKCFIRTNEIKYIGHTLTDKGLKPDEEKVRAVTELPPPQDKQELQRFLVMVQYLAKFIPNLSDISAPLRQLLDGDIEWHWEEAQKTSFENLKQLVTKAPTLKFYDVNKPVTLSVDASSQGLGAVLLQDGLPVAYGSRALTDCQQRYAQIEKELLAIVYGCEKFHQYVYGKDIQVESDHKPLESIFKKSLHQAPLRLQRMLLRLQRYSLKVTYKPGKELHIADTLSRAFLREKEDLMGKELEVNMITPQLPMSEEKLNKFKKATAEDPELQHLKERVQRGWPKERHAVHKEIQPYWKFKEEITYTAGLMFKGSKLIVPQRLRQEMLEKIHESHLGIVKCKERARDILY
uniref:ribonuclease H n=1 Tax=Oryzias latipes TaxID=8090 RepID=A0A3P9LFC2_ORYLA